MVVCGGSPTPQRAGLTGDTLGIMNEATVRDLRNHGGHVLDRVAAGERFMITRDGKPVALLQPIPRNRLKAQAVVERFRALPPVDPDALRRDIDAVIDQRL
jgi:prevent-host-death family protein